VLDLWYTDDGCFVGKADLVVKAYNLLLSPLSAIGLSVNASKCVMWRQAVELDTHQCPVPTVFSTTSPSALTVLGFPVAGTLTAQLKFAEDAAAKAIAASAAISSLNHAQGEAVLLRACGPTSRLRHLLRFDVDQHFAAKLAEADSCTLRLAERIIGRPPPDGWQRLAATPINDGGLGFDLVRDVDGRALSQWARDSAFKSLAAAAEDDRTNSLDAGTLLGLIEVALARPLPTAPSARAELSDVNEARDDAWIRSASSRAPFASAFLLASPGPDTTLDDNEFHDGRA